MEDLNKNNEEKSTDIIKQTPEFEDILNKETKKAENLKTALDIITTREALKKEGTVDKLVEEKEEELRNDAEAKRIQAETEKISKEVDKIKQEKEKELAELDKIISSKKKEIEELKVEADKEQAFFDSNKDILKYIGVREKKSLKTMKGLMYPASIIFVIVQILLSPLTFCGLLLETVVGIVGGICGSIKNNAIKIIIGILVVAIICFAFFSVYYYGGKYLSGT